MPASGKAREFADHAHAGARHHMPPLEPEVEQVAVDDHRLGVGGEPAQEREELAFGLGWCGAEMCIGEDVAGRGKHRTMLPRCRALYKGTRASGRLAADADRFRNPRALRRDRPDGCGVSRELSRLVRDRAHRLHPRARRDVRRDGAAGRPPGRLRRRSCATMPAPRTTTSCGSRRGSPGYDPAWWSSVRPRCVWRRPARRDGRHGSRRATTTSSRSIRRVSPSRLPGTHSRRCSSRSRLCRRLTGRAAGQRLHT